MDASLAYTYHTTGQQWQDSRVDGPVQAHHCQNGAGGHITGTAGRENGHQVQGQNEASVALSCVERGKPRKAGRWQRESLLTPFPSQVFIGEHLSARVSHLQLVLDHQDVVNKTKCSGLCVSTGTGSTSWHTSINRISCSDVEDLLRSLPNRDSPEVQKLLNNCEEIAQRYNQGLLFAPDDPRLCYSIREQICVGVWPKPKTFKARDFVQSVFVKSHCIDASEWSGEECHKTRSINIQFLLQIWSLMAAYVTPSTMVPRCCSRSFPRMHCSRSP